MQKEMILNTIKLIYKEVRLGAVHWIKWSRRSCKISCIIVQQGKKWSGPTKIRILLLLSTREKMEMKNFLQPQQLCAFCQNGHVMHQNSASLN